MSSVGCANSVYIVSYIKLPETGGGGVNMIFNRVQPIPLRM